MFILDFWVCLGVDSSPVRKTSELDLDLSMTQLTHSNQFHFRNIIQEGSLVSDKNGNDFEITAVEHDLIVLEQIDDGIEYDFGEGIYLGMFNYFWVF